MYEIFKMKGISPIKELQKSYPICQKISNVDYIKKWSEENRRGRGWDYPKELVNKSLPIIINHR